MTPSPSPAVHLLALPYDSGRRGERMGAGPERLLRAGLVGALRAAGREVHAETLEAGEGWRAEIATSFALYAALAGRVRRAAEAGRFPLVLSGNCGSALGTRGGLDGPVGVVWLDAHGDLHTPETTTSGFLDGMALAALGGRCWRAMASGIPGFAPVPEEAVVLVGARALDPAEEEALARGGIARVDAARVREEGVAAALEPALRALRSRVERVYLHVDLDVLDPDEAPANAFPAPGGLSATQVVEVIRAVRSRFTLAAAALTAYDPSVDPDGRTPAAALRLARALAGDLPP